MLRPVLIRTLNSILRGARSVPRPIIGSVLENATTRPTSNLVHAAIRTYANETKWSNEVLDDVVKKNKIVVFMKGTPLEPMCGFSKAVVTILQMHGVVEFAAYNVLEDDELRKKVKDYSSWPTVPQVYMNGEFLGGCDIMIQLHQNGELISELEKVGLRSVLSEEVD